VSCRFDQSLAAGYHSRSQAVRRMSEAWAAEHIICPSCGGALRQYANNRPVADFYCPHCAEDFELKSSAKPWGGKIMAGAYATMLARIAAMRNPNFFFLHYLPQENFRVADLFCVPKQFFTPEIIEKRKPLSPQAHRAGWVGCNILLAALPESGKIYYRRNSEAMPSSDILAAFAKTRFLRQEKPEGKSWLIDVMKQIDLLGRRQFDLSELYAAAAVLGRLHPDNHNVEAKIRQQLQILRDKGYLRFSGRGVYELS